MNFKGPELTVGSDIGGVEFISRAYRRMGYVNFKGPELTVGSDIGGVEFIS